MRRGIAPFLLGLMTMSVQAEEITPEGFANLPEADLIILGEIHDNPIHHEYQALAVEEIAPKALVFEMLTEAQALAIRPEMLGDAQVLSDALAWADSGWPDFAMYYPIFASAAGVPVFGGAAERDLVRQAVSDGAATSFGGAAAIFGLDRNLDDTQQGKREALQMSAHCDALPVTMLAGMVEAQRLRDAFLARAVLAAFAETGGPVALITGNGHARKDWGVPAVLHIAEPELRITSIAQFEAPVDDIVPYDYWLVTEPAERGDPCEAFK